MDVCSHCFQRDYCRVLFYSVLMKNMLYQRLLIIKVITIFNCPCVPIYELIKKYKWNKMEFAN